MEISHRCFSQREMVYLWVLHMFWLVVAGSHDAIGDVLEGVVQFGGDGANRPVHELLHQQLQLLLGQRHVETFLQAADRTGTVETREVRPCERGRSQLSMFMRTLSIFSEVWGLLVQPKFFIPVRRYQMFSHAHTSVAINTSLPCGTKFHVKPGISSKSESPSLCRWNNSHKVFTCASDHLPHQLISPKPCDVLLPCCMISTICRTFSMCFLAAIRPWSISIL